MPKKKPTPTKSRKLIEFMAKNYKGLGSACAICDAPEINRDVSDALRWMLDNTRIVSIKKLAFFLSETHSAVIPQLLLREHLRDGHDPKQHSVWSRVRCIR